MTRWVIFISLLSIVLVSNFTVAAEQTTDGWRSLFDGKTLNGWKPSENKGTFTVTDGMIVAHGARSHLFYTGPIENADFKNFEIKADVMTEPGANSGIYFHTEYQETGWPDKGYEVQVNNTHSDWRKTGGLYGVVDVRESPARDNQWFTEHIIVQDKHIIIKVDGKTTVDYTEPDDVNYPDFPGRKIARGTFALQGHDPKSVVYYKNIMVKPLPAERKKIKIVIVTGGLDFERDPFFSMFKGNEDIEYVEAQQKNDSEIFEDISKWDYDVIVLFNKTQEISPKRRQNFISLLNRGVGLVALHHSICSFQKWPEYKKIIGSRYYMEATEEGGLMHQASTYKLDVDLNVHVADTSHPVTQGVSDFQTNDEVYKNCEFEKDNHVLLTTDNPDSDKSIGWVRQYGKARVFTIQSGHSPRTYENPGYSRLVIQAIRWCAAGPQQKPLAELESFSQPIDVPSQLASVEGGQRIRGVNLSRLRPEMPFVDAIEQIKYSVKPPLNIAVLWNDLSENAGIDRYTEINMEGISGVTAGRALRLLLTSVSGRTDLLDYSVEDGLIIIATADTLQRMHQKHRGKMSTRVYDITDLVF